MFCLSGAEFAVSDWRDAPARGGWHTDGVKMIINSGRAAIHTPDLWRAARRSFSRVAD